MVFGSNWTQVGPKFLFKPLAVSVLLPSTQNRVMLSLAAMYKTDQSNCLIRGSIYKRVCEGVK
jgi:hypothetical protein